MCCHRYPIRPLVRSRLGARPRPSAVRSPSSFIAVVVVLVLVYLSICMYGVLNGHSLRRILSCLRVDAAAPPRVRSHLSFFRPTGRRACRLADRQAGRQPTRRAFGTTVKGCYDCEWQWRRWRVIGLW